MAREVLEKETTAGRRASHGALVFIEPISKDMRKLGYKKGDYITKILDIPDDKIDELETVIKDMWPT